MRVDYEATREAPDEPTLIQDKLERKACLETQIDSIGKRHPWVDTERIYLASEIDTEGLSSPMKLRIREMKDTSPGWMKRIDKEDGCSGFCAVGKEPPIIVIADHLFYKNDIARSASTGSVLLHEIAHREAYYERGDESPGHGLTFQAYCFLLDLDYREQVPKSETVYSVGEIADELSRFRSEPLRSLLRRRVDDLAFYAQEDEPDFDEDDFEDFLYEIGLSGGER